MSNDKKVKAFVTTDCPACKGFVRLSGEGKPGEKVRLEGHCPQGHLVFYPFTIRR